MAASGGANEVSALQNYEFDVFCSFSDSDNRFLTNSICETLRKDRVRIFKNDDPRGKEEEEEEEEDIMLKLKKALQRSKISIVFFSKNYVSSTSCLDELVMILESNKSSGKLLIPIFCDMDPSDLRSFPGNGSFGKQAAYKIEEWTKALKQVSQVAGFVLEEAAYDFDSSCIRDIIEVIENKLKTVGTQGYLSGTIRGFIDRAVHKEIIEAAGLEGERLSQKETRVIKSFLGPVKSFFQYISDSTDIPLSDLQSMYASGELNLSNRNIKSLPKTISSLVELRQLLLRDDKLLMELPSEIGALENLEVLDLEGTRLICLPKEIEELHQLECLKVSLNKYADSYIESNGIEAIIPRGALSKLRRLKELSINVDPDCKWWDAEAKVIIDELSKLVNLKILKMYFPTEELLDQFLPDPMNVYESLRRLSNFRLIVGFHEPDIVSFLPNDLKTEFEKLDKCLKYVNGEEITRGICMALEHAKALFLYRHWTIEKLSKFMVPFPFFPKYMVSDMCRPLVCCLVVECNEMNTIIDGSDFYEDVEGGGENGRRPVLEFLSYLSIHRMKNLQCIWKGPIVTGCLFRLQILALHTCPELITIFNPGLLRNLVSLKELIVKYCPKLESLVSVEARLLESDRSFLPCLENILLVDLPELLSISNGLKIAPKLQKIVVHDCPKLKNPSHVDKYNEYVHVIKDESQWSKALDSTSKEIDYLHRLSDEPNKSEYSTYQPFRENQASRTEDPVLDKDVLNEDYKNESLPSELEYPQSSADEIHEQDNSTNEVSIVSIFGITGIGKTTIAKALYNSNFEKFEGSCFLSNIGKYSRKPDGLVRLQALLVSSMPPKEKGKRVIIDDVSEGLLRIINAVTDKRVLIVLDDVDDSSQLQALIGKPDWYCPGSKIIFTTRDKKLADYRGSKVHEVETLSEEESLRLFSLNAFGTPYPDIGYEHLSERLVKHCGGIPLASAVLGSSLSTSNLSVYHNLIEKMEPTPQHKVIDPLTVINTLKVCFDSLLHDHDKDLFLRIACSFLGKDTDYVTKILDGCGFHARNGIQTLANRCFLTIDRDNKLRMHQLLEDMGRDIVRREESSGKHRIVWEHRDALDVLRTRTIKGKETIESLVVDFPVDEEPLTYRRFFSMSSALRQGKTIFKTRSFSRIDNLRLLQLNNIKLTGGYKKFPKGLVWLCWRGFPSRSLPTKLPKENLVVLDLRYSSLKQVWKNTKVLLPSLKILNLSHSHYLTNTPDLSGLPNLESLILKDCKNLRKVDKCIMELEMLSLVNLKGCIKLRELPIRILYLGSLKKLVLSSFSLHLIQQELPSELEAQTKLHISD